MPHGNRPPATKPLHSLLDTLADLQQLLDRLYKRMSHTGTNEKAMSAIEAYDSFTRASEFGRDCQFSRKCELIFQQHDYEDIKKLITEATTIIEKIEALRG